MIAALLMELGQGDFDPWRSRFMVFLGGRLGKWNWDATESQAQKRPSFWGMIPPTSPTLPPPPPPSPPTPSFDGVLRPKKKNDLWFHALFGRN